MQICGEEAGGCVIGGWSDFMCFDTVCMGKFGSRYIFLGREFALARDGNGDF